MLRLAVRILGIFALAGAFVAAVIDGTRSIAAGEISMVQLGEQMQILLGPKFSMLQPFIEHSLSPIVWNQVVVRLLMTPIWVVLLVLGVGFLAATQQRRGEIGFSTRL